MDKTASHIFSALVGACLCYYVFFMKGVSETAYLNGQLSVIKNLSVSDLQKTTGVTAKESKK